MSLAPRDKVSRSSNARCETDFRSLGICMALRDDWSAEAPQVQLFLICNVARPLLSVRLNR